MTLQDMAVGPYARPLMCTAALWYIQLYVHQLCQAMQHAGASLHQRMLSMLLSIAFQCGVQVHAKQQFAEQHGCADGQEQGPACALHDLMGVRMLVS